MTEYKQVPVAVAKQIAEQFDKSMVVINAYDPVHKVTATTTYGVSPFDKENAAAAGEITATALGNDLSKKQTFEDFHDDYNPAIQKAALELMQKLVARNDGGSPWAVQQMEKVLKMAGKNTRFA